MFYLETLGTLALYRSDRPDEPVIGGSKPLMLPALLATISDRSSTREHLAELLWPESDHVRSRRSLRQALFHISKHSGRELIISDENNSTLRLDEGILSVDLWEFEAALKQEDYRRAIELYGGPFLKGFERKAGREVEHQIEAENSRIRVGLEVAYTKLVSSALKRGNYEDAVRWAGQFVEMNPLDDRAQATLVRALKASGDEVGALAAYQRYRTLLRQVLEEEPDADLQKAMEQVREEVLSTPADEASQDADEEPQEDEKVAVGEVGEPEGRAEEEVEVGTVEAEPREIGVPGAAEEPASEAEPERWRIRRRFLDPVALAVALPALLLAVGAVTWSLWTIRGAAQSHDELSEPVFAVLGSQEGGRIVRIRQDGGNLEIEPTSQTSTDRPSPDGGRIAFVVRSPNGWNLAVRDQDGRDTLVLTTRAGDELPEAWSPDGRYLLYWETALLAGGRERAHRLNVWDTRLGTGRRLTDLESRTTPSAVWSPDGTHVALEADRGGRPDIFVVDFDGTDLVNVSRHPARDVNPAWSPDGSRLAFVSERGGRAELYTVERDGSELQRITEREGAPASPIWASPTLLIFVLETESGRDLWAGDLVNGELRQLTRRGDLAALMVNFRSEWRSWIERIEIVPPLAALSPGQHFELEIVALDAAEDSFPSGVVEIDWSIANPEILERRNGWFHVLGPGRTTIIASAAGWRADTLHLFSLPLIERLAEVTLEEDWVEGLDSTRWIPFGQPRPFVRARGAPGGAGFLVNNGDAHFESGVVSKEVYTLEDGLGAEAYGRMPFTGQLFQTWAVALFPEAPTDSIDWVATTPALAFVLSGPSADQPAEARVFTPDWTKRFPFPQSTDEWRHYALQVTPEGFVEVIVDGRLHWRSNRRLPVESIGPVRVGLGYQSMNTEIAHGPIRVYRPPRLLFLENDPGQIPRLSRRRD